MNDFKEKNAKALTAQGRFHQLSEQGYPLIINSEYPHTEAEQLYERTKLELALIKINKRQKP